MTTEAATDLIAAAVGLGLTLAVPVLLVVCASALATGLLQTMTQIHDPTLTALPRLIAGGLTLWLLLPWMLDRLSSYTIELYRHIGAG